MSLVIYSMPAQAKNLSEIAQITGCALNFKDVSPNHPAFIRLQEVTAAKIDSPGTIKGCGYDSTLSGMDFVEFEIRYNPETGEVYSFERWGFESLARQTAAKERWGVE
jgi:hypothetical protein